MGPRYEYFKAYFACPKVRKRRLQWQLEYQAANRIKMFDILGRRCILCGFSDIRALQLDHIKGNGYKERKKFGNTHNMVVFYLKNPNMLKNNLQILCANCNWIKRHTNKEFKPRRYK